MIGRHECSSARRRVNRALGSVSARILPKARDPFMLNVPIDQYGGQPFEPGGARNTRMREG